MARDPDALHAQLQSLIAHQARGRLRALGLARSMVWRDGRVPEGGPSFQDDLTEDLLDYGYGVLAMALELRDANQERAHGRAAPFTLTQAFQIAAECIESAVRRADPADRDRGRHLVVSAAASHLAGYAARSFSLLATLTPSLNLASTERALALLLRRDLAHMREHVRGWLADRDHDDDRIAARLRDETDTFDATDAVLIALSATYYRALGYFDTALDQGNAAVHDAALEAFDLAIEQAAGAGQLSIWWVATLAKHLARDLWDHSLHVRLPLAPAPYGPELPARWAELRRSYIQVLGASPRPKVDLWPSQLAAAARAPDPTDDLIVALPTSSGKTRIAELCILRALADKGRTIYITPLRALSAQVEQTLSRTFVPLGASVTSLYGATGATSLDSKTLADADIVVATPEKLDFALRQDPAVLDDVALVILDEGHMIGAGSREIRYEVLIQRLLRRDDAQGRRIVCLSAMFNPTDEFFQDFGDWLRHDDKRDPVHVDWRPTRQLLATLRWVSTARGWAARLDFSEGEKPYVPRFFDERPPTGQRSNAFPQDDQEYCVATTAAFARDGHDVLVYSPQRRQIEPVVKKFTTAKRQRYLDHLRVPNPKDIEFAMAVGREWLGAQHAVVKALEVGVGTHHAHLPRPFQSAIEELLHARKLPVVVASPTLAQGVDLACGVLVFRSLKRFDVASGRLKLIEPPEFSNVVGRAGRAYVDLDGIAVFPTFKQGRARDAELAEFADLVKRSRGHRLVSGLAILVSKIGKQICERLRVPEARFIDYVLNQHDLWSNVRLEPTPGKDEDGVEQDLDEMLSDLDVALLSLVSDLDTPVNDLATTLDEMLTGSLWQRSVARLGAGTERIQREVLRSRARWLWNRTTLPQRVACFACGLGRRTGVFLYDRLDKLVPLLVDFHAASLADAPDAARTAAVAFAALVFEDPFFVPYDTPDDWAKVLGDWIEGKPFAEILAASPKAGGFVQDGAVFKLVWAAEAVRVQATLQAHARAQELGDGPALSLTHGVPSVSAAILCQSGYASRAGALWLKRQLNASFMDFSGMQTWEWERASPLADPAFWESADQRLLWERSRVRDGVHRFAWLDWEHSSHEIAVAWKEEAPADGTGLRLISLTGRRAAVCDESLVTIGDATLPFDPRGAAVTARARAGGGLQVDRFGPPLETRWQRRL